jgi:hypothetical protein
MARMRRRDFVKAMVAAPAAAKAMFAESAAPPAPPAATTSGASTTTSTAEALAGSAAQTDNFNYLTYVYRGSVADQIAAPEGHHFNTLQMATLRRMGEIMMPPMEGYPGATQAGAPEFLDFLISVSPMEQKNLYGNGLERLNLEAHKKFQKPFSEVSEEEADALLKPNMRTWLNDHPPTEPYLRFINVAHFDLRRATMNSREWSVAATSSGDRAPGIGQYWSPIDPDIEKYV